MNWKNPAIDEPEPNKDYLVRMWFRDGTYTDVVETWRPAYQIWCNQDKRDTCERTRYCEIPEFDGEPVSTWAINHEY